MITAEAALVGLALLNATAASALPVHERHFEDRALAGVWSAVRKAVAAGEPTDAIAIGKASGVPGAKLVRLTSALLDAGVADYTLPHYANRVIDEALRRDVLAAVRRVAAEGDRLEGAALLTMAQSELGLLSAKAPAAKSMRELAEAYMARWEQVAEERMANDGVDKLSAPTGIPALDRLMGGGFRLSQTHVLGAATSVGKSSCAIGVCLASARAGHVVDLYGLEDEAEATFARFVAQDSPSIDGRSLHTFNAPQQPFVAATQRLVALDISTVDRMPPTVDELAWQMRHRAAERGSTLIVLDYIQKAARKAKGEGIYDRATAVSAAMFDVARDTGAAVLILSQRNRVEGDDNRSLKGAGEIAEDAYSVLLLKRHAVYDDECRTDPETGGRLPIPVVEAHLTKSKNGPTGRVLLEFDGEHGLFRQAHKGLIARYVEASR